MFVCPILFLGASGLTTSRSSALLMVIYKMLLVKKFENSLNCIEESESRLFSKYGQECHSKVQLLIGAKARHEEVSSC